MHHMDLTRHTRQLAAETSVAGLVVGEVVAVNAGKVGAVVWW